MRSIDTNILVRWITRDDAVQSPMSDRIMQTPVYIPLTVLIELAWVLRGEPYRMTRQAITQSLTLLLDMDTVTIPSDGLVRWAVDRHEAGADFADMLHLIASRGTRAFVSFERCLADLAGPDTPTPVERLT